MHFESSGLTCLLYNKNMCLILLTFITLLHMCLCMANSEHYKNVSDMVDEVLRKEISLDVKVVDYLEKYGYLSRRIVDKVADRTHSNVDKDHAIRTFQVFANMNQTGRVDEPTSEMMSKPRCGFVDILPNTDRTLPMKLENPAKWKSKSVKWKIAVFSKKLTIEEQREAVINSFRVWTDNSGLTVEETDEEDADIVIKFARGEHGDGKINAFDGKGKSVAHAFLPPDGRTHFDEDEDWTFQNNNGTEFQMTAIHELGHSLGLIHSTARESIMAPFYKKYTAEFTLHPIDVLGIQELYGPPILKEGHAPIVDANNIGNTPESHNEKTDHDVLDNDKKTNTTMANAASNNNTMNNNNAKNNEINNSTINDDSMNKSTKDNIAVYNNTVNSAKITLNHTMNYNITAVNNTKDNITSFNNTTENTITNSPASNTTGNTTIPMANNTTHNNKTKKKDRFNICKTRVDAVCGGKDGHINMFVGRYVYKLYSYCLEGQNCVLEGFPQLIRSVYKKGPKRVHAAAYIQDVRKRTYLFKGRKVWRYTGRKLDPGYPLRLTTSDLPYKPSAAYAQKTPYADYQLYLFSGKYFWELNMYTNKMVYNSLYYTATYWDHMPKKPDAITQTKDGNIYVFKGKHYRKYDHRRGIVSKKNRIAPAWIGRQCGFGNKDDY